MPQTKEERRKTGRKRVELWIREKSLQQLDSMAVESGFTRSEFVEVLVQNEAGQR